MYKCTECQEEYNEKPDYCKCGNDEFEEIIPSTSTHTQDYPQNHGNSTIPYKKITIILFFIGCIILAILPWLFHPATTEQKSDTPTKTEIPQIPDIDNIWQNPTQTVVPAKQEELPKTASQSKQISPQKLEQKPSKTKNKPQQIQKTNSQTVSAKTKTSTKTTQQTDKKIFPQPSTPQSSVKLPQSTLNAAAGSKPIQPSSPATDKVQNTKPQATTQIPEPPKMNAQEFLTYKGAIRNALLAKLNLAAIPGSGDCAIEFSLDKDGKLINRAFIYKSSNTILNDEVYLMLMRLPYYKKPPENYNGEKIKLKIYINNGYYEISFI